MHDNGIEELITKLYDMVQDARSLPLGADKCIVERDKVLDMLDGEEAGAFFLGGRRGMRGG